ncbi:hypothetical protein [Streptomyces sp. NPDC018031]|uniref:hypothetical protein n=1 Tax=Streptomyces sp. NPDC018031 TaxID=3365033 RepID=UPI0037BC79F8
MTTKFEDRLLAELTCEVERRAAERPEPVPVRRTVARRGAGWGLAACGAAAAVVVALPGSPGASPAYAVEKNADGTITVSIEDVSLSEAEQRELADELRAAGVAAHISAPPVGKVCDEARGKHLGDSLMLQGAPEASETADAPAGEAGSGRSTPRPGEVTKEKLPEPGELTEGKPVPDGTGPGRPLPEPGELTEGKPVPDGTDPGRPLPKPGEITDAKPVRPGEPLPGTHVLRPGDTVTVQNVRFTAKDEGRTAWMHFYRGEVSSCRLVPLSTYFPGN